MHNPDIHAVMSLLSAEQEALREGAFEKVAEIGQHKEAILSDLGQLKLTRDQAKQLQREADRTAKMLAAALSGVKDAQARLAALQDIKAGLSVYTAGGARETVAPSASGLEHKV